jgi:predicted nucleotidyltransferase
MEKAKIDSKATARMLKEFFQDRKEVLFAYLHGSFIQGKEFRDIDVAVFLDAHEPGFTDVVEYEIALSLQAEKKVGLPVDIKILNSAPLSFRYHATRGILLFSQDESVREDFLSRTWSEYFDFLPLSRIYQEELTRA